MKVILTFIILKLYSKPVYHIIAYWRGKRLPCFWGGGISKNHRVPVEDVHTNRPCMSYKTILGDLEGGPLKIILSLSKSLDLGFPY